MTGTDFNDGQVNWKTAYHVAEERYHEDPYIKLHNGDLLITKDGTIGKTAIVRGMIEPATLNSGIFLTRSLKNQYTTEYMYWVLNSDSFDSFIELLKTGTTIAHLYQNVFVRFKYPLPPLPEQQAIAAFLDRETGRIDALIAKKQRLLELLAEQRTALISRAVTKGLDASVKLKPSGVEWLGDVPEHWILKRLKSVGRFKAGAGFPDDEQGHEEGELPFFKVADMTNPGNEVFMKTANNYIAKSTARKLGAYVFKSQTVIFAKVGAALLLNRRRIISQDSCIDNNTMGYELRTADFKYIYYWLTPIDFGRLSNPGAVPSINDGQLREIPIALPPLLEQQAIAAFLYRETSKIDALSAKVTTVIERLKEYRTALISSAVTGKIDVSTTLNTSVRETV